MKITLDRESMPDELYNELLMNFVREAVTQGLDVTPATRFEEWRIECEVKPAMN